MILDHRECRTVLILSFLICSYPPLLNSINELFMKVLCVSGIASDSYWQQNGVVLILLWCESLKKNPDPPLPGFKWLGLFISTDGITCVSVCAHCFLPPCSVPLRHSLYPYIRYLLIKFSLSFLQPKQSQPSQPLFLWKKLLPLVWGKRCLFSVTIVCNCADDLY